MSKLPDPTATLDEKGREVYDTLTGPRGTLRGMYLSLMNHPELAAHVGQLGTYFRFEGELRGDLRELGILVTAHGMGTPFIWIQHVEPAKKEGLPDSVVEDVLKSDPVSSGMDELYRQVWQLARHVVAQEVVPKQLQESIQSVVGVKQVVELVAVCGFYRFIASIAVGFDVEMPPHDGELPF